MAERSAYLGGDGFSREEAWNEQQEVICENLGMAKDYWGDADGSIDTMIERLKQPYNSENYPTPFEVSNVGYSGTHVNLRGRPTWAGKQAMLDSSWEGLRNF
jgi:hypothetical protein